jgi:hypothetical protein
MMMGLFADFGLTVELLRNAAGRVRQDSNQQQIQCNAM